MDASDKINRKLRRCEKRRKRYKLDNLELQRYTNRGLSFSQARSQIRYGYFYDSYGEKKQICDYMGTCQYPCNGDC